MLKCSGIKKLNKELIMVALFTSNQYVVMVLLSGDMVLKSLKSQSQRED